MDIKTQISFLNGPKNGKYKKWAIGTSWAYEAYNEFIINDILEITCWHLRLYVYGRIFDFYPMNKKINSIRTKKWTQIANRQHFINYIKTAI